MVETPRTGKDEWAFEGKPNGPSAQVGETERPSVIKGSRMKVRNEADVITSSRVAPQGRNIFTLSQQFIIAGRGFCIMKPAPDKTEVIH